MMHEGEKSDLAIVAVKPTNKAGRSAAELVEPRRGPKGMRASKARTGRRAGQRDPGAGAHTTNCKGKEEGEVHCAVHHITPRTAEAEFSP